MKDSLSVKLSRWLQDPYDSGIKHFRAPNPLAALRNQRHTFKRVRLLYIDDRDMERGRRVADTPDVTDFRLNAWGGQAYFDTFREFYKRQLALLKEVRSETDTPWSEDPPWPKPFEYFTCPYSCCNPKSIDTRYSGDGETRDTQN